LDLPHTRAEFEAQPQDPIIFIAFDQQIDPEAVLETISVTASREQFDLSLVTQEEAEEDEQIKRRLERTREGYWLAFRADELFPTDTTVVVNVGPDTPSVEGPLTTESVQSFSFQTFAPLRIERHFCGFSADECPPMSPFEILFNNSLDLENFDESMISVEPEIPNLRVETFGSVLFIQGTTQGRTTYEVTISTEVKDIFGQSLEEDQTIEFTTTEMPRFFTGPDSHFITLDPSTNTPTFNIFSVNYDSLRVRAYAVQPEEWPLYLEFYRRNAGRGESNLEPPGTQVLSDEFAIDAEQDEMVETAIPLRDALGGDTGHLIVIVDSTEKTSDRDRGFNRTVISWVQVTQIGLDAFVDHSEMLVWANALSDGAPLAGVEVSLLANRASATTNQKGITRLDLSTSSSPLLIGRLDNDVAFLPQSDFPWSDGGWQKRPTRDELRWYVFDDRQMYRPGEEVHVKGWLRSIGMIQESDIELAPDFTSVSYQVRGPRGNEITTGVADINALGGFDINFDLPPNINLGSVSVSFRARGSQAEVNNIEFFHFFQVQEFRRPEFEVSARVETVGPFFVKPTSENAQTSDNTSALVAVEGTYFTGGVLPNAEVSWQINASPGDYSPPGWDGFIFGQWTPWWFFGFDEPSGESFQSFNSFTDATGTHYLDMSFEGATEHRPYSVQAQGTVIDVNRQAWTASANLLVHSAARYVGIRSASTFVEQGTPLEIEAIVTDLDGDVIGDATLEMTAERLVWKRVDGEFKEEAEDTQSCIIISTDEPVLCTFTTDVGGRYRITATVQDEEGRKNQSQFIRWVSGGQSPPSRGITQEEVQIIPDKESYQPGDVAEILIQTPFLPAEGLLTLRRNGILYTERFTMDEGTCILNIPIEDGHTPNLHVQVDLTGASARTDDAGEPLEGVPDRPAYASGSLNLSIPPLHRTLALEVMPQAEMLEPGAETTVDVIVTDADGEAVADAEIALVVVDEAILALTNYQLTDPVATFYRELSGGVNNHYARASILLASPLALAQDTATTAMDKIAGPAGPAALGGAMARGAMPMASMAEDAMEESASLAFSADEGDAAADDGTDSTQVELTLPDNLTRYRVMAVAVAKEKHFGSGEANITARLPIMVRPSPPRFLNFGDQFELPIVVQNQTDEDMDVSIVVQGSNIVLDDGVDASGQLVTVPANDRVEVRFPAETENAGTTRFQIAAASEEYADAAAAELPVFTPATTEAFATYGVVDEGAIAQPVAAPVDVFPQFGGLEVNTSSTALQALTDAMLYLTAYPFDSSEQLASRILAVAALRDVLTAFEAEQLPAPEELEKAVARDIERLQGLQNFDGGFPVWVRGRESKPYYTIHVVHALQRAKLKGFDVPDNLLRSGFNYLRDIEFFYPSWYGENTRNSLSAYALYVRQLAGDVDTLKARKLFSETGVDVLNLEAIAWLLQVLSGDPASTDEVESIRRHLINRAVETAGAANFTTSYGDQDYVMLHSNRRTDGVILDALIQDTPESDLIPKVVNGLLANQTRGRWRNTQENSFILLALDRYFNTFEDETPDFVANIWLGDTYVGGHEFEGRTTERHRTEIPMEYLVENIADEDASSDLLLSKEGDGRLYYRLGLSYAPEDLDLDPLDVGFVVERSYEAVDDEADVTRDEDGTWRIKAGARVRVRLNMVNTNRRYHVALVDPLPAGLESINPALAVSGDVPEDPNDPANDFGWWWRRSWYEHQNLRDERAEAFTTLLWQGVHNYTYVARATTPGIFVVPPAKAEEMYSPEVFGRSGTDRVVVE